MSVAAPFLVGDTGSTTPTTSLRIAAVSGLYALPIPGGLGVQTWDIAAKTKRESLFPETFDSFTIPGMSRGHVYVVGPAPSYDLIRLSIEQPLERSVGVPDQLVRRPRMRK